jgi:hypothetical protein
MVGWRDTDRNTAPSQKAIWPDTTVMMPLIAVGQGDSDEHHDRGDAGGPGHPA